MTLKQEQFQISAAVRDSDGEDAPSRAPSSKSARPHLALSNVKSIARSEMKGYSAKPEFYHDLSDFAIGFMKGVAKQTVELMENEGKGRRTLKAEDLIVVMDKLKIMGVRFE